MLIRCPVCSAQCNCYFAHCAQYVCHTKGCRTGEVRPLDHLGGPYNVIPVFVQTDTDAINNSKHDYRNNKRHAFPLPATAADPGNVVTVFFHYRDAVAYALVVTGMGRFYGLELKENNEFLPEGM